MGGNALKEYGVERVDRETYLRIKDFVLDKLTDVTVKAQVPYFVDNKDDFGDVDILAIIKPEYTNTIRKWIQDTFSPLAIKSNGNVHSFNVEKLQIDLITTSEENYNPYFHFLCWGDLSMVMGRVSRLWDLKYGIYGLEMPVRDPETNHVVSEITISKDPPKIFEFMGYSYERWKQGFKDLESLRDYLFSSPRIHRDFLTANSEDTKHRKRDRLRSAYNTLYQWFNENRESFPEKAKLPIPEKIEDKLAYIEKHFPESDLTAKYYLVRKRIKDSTEARNKFSGKHLQEMFPELQGKEFGDFMQMWSRQWSSKEEQVQFILKHDVSFLENLAHKIRKELP